MGQSRHRTSGGIAERDRDVQVQLLESLPFQMVIKESSDELNPPMVIGGASVSQPRPARSLKDYLALSVATCGVGYLPLAPGTWGSILAVGIYLLWHLLRLRFFGAYGDGHWIPLSVDASWTAFTFVMVVSVTISGSWAATRVEQLSGSKDSRIVVIDEVAGQLIALLFIPYFLWLDWPLIVAGFLLFRIFDIWKPYPIRHLEALESGMGVMADDILAGFYAAASLSVIVVVRSFFVV